MTPVAPGVGPRVGAKPSLWDVPPALWLYALLRSLAFVAPSWSEDGHIGLGVVPVMVLFVFVLRRARWAWTVLVGLDVFSLVMLVTIWFDTEGAPLATPVLAALALITLLLPSVRRFVGISWRRPTPSVPSSGAPSSRASTGAS